MALKSSDIVTIQLTMDEVGSLIAALRKAEEIAVAARGMSSTFAFSVSALSASFETLYRHRQMAKTPAWPT